jgi:hypothetical protein
MKTEKIDPIKAIVRAENYAGQIRPVIFFSNVESSLGMLQYLSEEGHGEASLNYYHETKKPTPELINEAVKLLQRAGYDLKTELRFYRKLPVNFRKDCWS